MPVCPGARLRLGYVYALAEPLYKTLNLKLRLTLHAKRGIFAYLEGFVNNYVEIMKTAGRRSVFSHLTRIAYWEELCCSASVLLV